MSLRIRNLMLISFLVLIWLFGMSWGHLSASERTILIGPKTIGPGWKDAFAQPYVVTREQIKELLK